MAVTVRVFVVGRVVEKWRQRRAEAERLGIALPPEVAELAAGGHRQMPLASLNRRFGANGSILRTPLPYFHSAPV